MVAAVVRGNDALLFKAYGRADVEWDVPMPAGAMFEAGSVTKQVNGSPARPALWVEGWTFREGSGDAINESIEAVGLSRRPTGR
jgi:hypothetical protein